MVTNAAIPFSIDWLCKSIEQDHKISILTKWNVTTYMKCLTWIASPKMRWLNSFKLQRWQFNGLSLEMVPLLIARYWNNYSFGIPSQLLHNVIIRSLSFINNYSMTWFFTSLYRNGLMVTPFNSSTIYCLRNRY